jgi:Fe-S-cluster-containing dehydrogenase component
MDKCTGCFHRLFSAAGSTLPAARQQPACVVTCTSLALKFGDLATVDTWAQRRAAAPVQAATSPPPGGKDIADPTLTVPSVRFTPQSNA